MDVYACDVCGYYYDPRLGDEVNMVGPDTPFPKLPKGWACPECGAGKAEFYRLEDDIFEYDDDDELENEEEDEYHD